MWRGIMGLMLMGTVGCGLAMAEEEEKAPSEATLGLELQSLQPGGSCRLGLRLTMAPGWHTYWVNPGDTGTPLMMTWQLPVGVTVSPFEWPIPERISDGSMVSYGFHGEVVLIATLSVASTVKFGTLLTLRGTPSWLVCQGACLMAEEEVEIVLPIRQEAPRLDTAWAVRWHEIKDRYPTMSSRWTSVANWTGEKLILTIKSVTPNVVGPRDIYFFADDPMMLESAAPQLVESLPGGEVRMVLQPAQFGTPTHFRLRGVAASRMGWGPEKISAIKIDADILLNHKKQGKGGQDK